MSVWNLQLQEAMAFAFGFAELHDVTYNLFLPSMKVLWRDYFTLQHISHHLFFQLANFMKLL